MGYTSLMASDEKDTFGISGPRLTVIDWNKAYHRMSIVASLVKGVYVQESDRKKNRRGQNALAPPWWKSFNFKLFQVLEDPADESIFGCIYELEAPDPSYNNRTPIYPKYVVAFRGTIIKPENMLEDFKLNFRIMFNGHQKSSRFKLGLQSVWDIIPKAEARSIWLAGHSLGSSIALLVGRSMVKSGFHLETYLFNPPFAGLPYENIFKDEKLKRIVRTADGIVTAVGAVVSKLDTRKPKQDEEFRDLSAWIPHLFVNPSDPVCSEYIGYFTQRKKMMTFPGGKIGRHAAQNSITSVVLNSIGKDCDAFHLLPSADLTINYSPSQGLHDAHGIRQWLRPEPDLHLVKKLHRFT